MKLNKLERLNGTYNTIIFDLDGTLLDTLEDLTDSVNFSLEKNNLPKRTKTQVRSFLVNGILRLMELAVPNELDNQSFDTVFQDFKEHYLENCNIKTKPYEGISLLLSKLKNKGKRLAVVSNKHDTAVKHLCGLHFGGRIVLAVGENESASGVRRKHRKVLFTL